ncbi:MAG: DMT family transporter [Thermoproteota archaeon]
MSPWENELAGCLYVSVAAVIWGFNGVIVNQVPLNAYATAFFRVLFASLAYAGFIILSKKTLENCSSLTVASYSYLASTLILSPSLLSMTPSLNLSSWILLFILGVFNTAFAVTLYLNGLRLIKAQKAVVFTYLEPVSAAIAGFILLGQQLTLQTLTGGLMILSAGYLVGSR